MKSVYPGEDHPVLEEVRRRLAVLPFDGGWDDRLIHRIRGFQRLYGLPADGVLDDTTLAKIGLEPL